MAKHYFAITEKFFSLGNSFLLAYAMGNKPSSYLCNNAAPTPESDASACSINGLSKSGNRSMSDLVSLSLRVLNE